MWLLDANLDVHLVELLKGFQIDCDRAENRGWKALRNGELIAAAAQAGFESILTGPDCILLHLLLNLERDDPCVYTPVAPRA